MPDNATEIAPHQLDEMVSDLMIHNPRIYWVDFIISCSLGWFFLIVSIFTTPLSLIWAGSLGISGIAFYRCITFIHEIIHFKYRKGILTGFPTIWNITCGAFFFLPYFMYAPHREHHTASTFGTVQDPEYFPGLGKTPMETFLHFLLFFVFPVFMVLRFIILGPLSWLTQGKLRKFILEKASALELNPDYTRDVKPDEIREILAQEILVLFVWSLVALGVYMQLIPVYIFLSFYILYVLVLSLNHFQTLVAHWYTNTSRKELTFDAQIRDSITVEGPFFFAQIILPLGLQYHSTHHLFPTMPYHSLQKAHYRLKEKLPKDHPYQTTTRHNFFKVLSTLWKK